MIESLTARILGRREDPPDPLEPLVPATVTLRRGSLVPLIGGILSGMQGPAAAVALGRTIIVHPDVVLTRRLLLHELVHVRQWQRDPLFPVRYALETVRNGYRGNRYEREARSAESSAREHPSERTT